MKTNRLEIILEKIPNILIGYAFIFLTLKIYTLVITVNTNLKFGISSWENDFIVLLRYILSDLSDYFTVPLWAIAIAFSIKFIHYWIK